MRCTSSQTELRAEACQQLCDHDRDVNCHKIFEVHAFVKESNWLDDEMMGEFRFMSFAKGDRGIDRPDTFSAT